MPASQPHLAVVFDFDDTLTADSTSALIEKYGVKPESFWNNDVNSLVQAGWDVTCAYLHLLLELSRIGKIPNFTAQELRKFGSRLKPYPGLPSLFKDLRKIAAEEGFGIEFYIVSGGLQDIIDGFSLRQEFASAWGCQLAADQPNAPLRYVKRTITFTEKTRYLFEINKGIPFDDAKANPYLVNRDVPNNERRIPFRQMIYIGDGLSDIPCFSLLTKRPESDQGLVLGVFQPGDQKSAKKAWLELIATKRVMSAHAPRYGRTHELGSILRTVVQTRCADIKLKTTLRPYQ